MRGRRLPTLPDSERAAERPWWRDAVVYQVYVRSFADANGDGTGDLAGVRAHLAYLAELGVDALWFNPWYPSPLADAGYDIVDYRSIDPAFGTLSEAEQLIVEARALGMRTIVDIVPNHVSSQHPWFKEALVAPAGSAARQRFWFRPGKGAEGELPPNQWQSIFGGSAWTRVADGEWYLHLFAPEQPDLNWERLEVWEEHEDILRFWFDRGVAGVRIDSAALLLKDPELSEELPDAASGEHPFTDRDELHDVYRRWRAVADSYAEPRVLVGEVWLPDAERLARICAPTSSTPRSTLSSWRARGSPVRCGTRLSRRSRLTHLSTRQPPGCSPITMSHVRSHATGVPTPASRLRPSAKGHRRTLFAASAAPALPRSWRWRCLVRCTSTRAKSSGCQRWRISRPRSVRIRCGSAPEASDPGRDGCRVALPWSGTRPPYGFSPNPSVRLWLDHQPDDWAPLSVEAQSADPGSMLSLYRAGLRTRRQAPWGAGAS